eukprot:CAMPEP_0196586424 /NCGR_PEP_ID=MMETSP1081-20130531/54229_1 /TAXON_ID=36882 /ORGANISM="Pyramimonas amylifera, Strain CCMP720" /LENGTH=188 /DNA_ID=CAMNT_0041908297 /DNA_START=246 /DNA_END=812 /DNA_ORIENTATION=+
MTLNQTYTRVRQSEEDEDLLAEPTEADKIRHEAMLKLKKRSDRRKIVRQKFEAFLWVAVALAILCYGDGNRNFFTMLLHNVRLERSYLHVGYALLGVNTCIFCYLALYLTVAKKQDNWEVVAPWAIPTATIIGLIMCLMFMLALWPVYGWFTPLVQFTLFMGMLLSNHFIPSFGYKPRDSNESEYRID